MKKILSKLGILFGSLKEAESIKIKVSRFFLGFLFFQIINKLGILLINPLIIFLFETKTAIIVMIVVSFIIRYILIKIYDNQKIDWFGLEKFKQWYKQWDGTSLIDENRTRMISIMIFILKKGGKYFGKPLLILVFIPYDPFLTVIIQRKGFNAWNNIPSLTTFLLFILSVTTCSFIYLGIFDILVWLWEIIKNIFYYLF
ncbi:MAG: hypothetical protein WC603_00465 [Candidatus Paceibacterota bacterium]|jgi:hypothetical protein